jgi:hypothetical protein
MMRRLLPAVLALVAVPVLADGAQAQLNPGVHVARAADFENGAWGVGASAELSFPLLPVDVFVAGDWFFPDCTYDCSLWGGSADLHLTMPFPVLSPYGTAGIVYRSYTYRVGDVETSTGGTGFGLGAGVNLGTIVLGAYAEARYEFVDPDDQLVFRLGIRF